MTAFALQAPSRFREWRDIVTVLASLLPADTRRRRTETPAASHHALRNQDPDAWRIVFESEHAAIYRYAISRLGSAPEAEDTTSQVFAEAWEHAATFGEQGLPVRAWLFGIARNVVNNHRRRWRRRPPVLAIDPRDHVGHDPLLDPERLDLARAVAGLEASWAEVVTLRFVHGLSVQETAAALGISLDAVKGKQARALARLRIALESPGR